jgi:hypothetical protein
MTTDTNPSALTIDKIGTVSPALARFTTETIEGNLWKRRGMEKRAGPRTGLLLVLTTTGRDKSSHGLRKRLSRRA